MFIYFCIIITVYLFVTVKSLFFLSFLNFFITFNFEMVQSKQEGLGFFKGVMTCNFHFSTRINVCYDCLTIIHWPGSRYLKVKRLFTPGFINQRACTRTQIRDFDFSPLLTSRRGRISHIWTPQTYAAGSPPLSPSYSVQSRKMEKRVHT